MAVDQTEVCVPDYPVWGVGPSIPVGFTVQGDGTVGHVLTGLLWQQDSAPAGKLSWFAANDYCQALTLGTYSDWRLPSAAELSSAFILGREESQFGLELPFLPKLPFPTPNAVPGYWTASQGVADSGLAWLLDPDWSLMPRPKDEPGQVRCVRGNTTTKEPVPRFEFPSSEVVHDRATGLSWQRCSPPDAVTLADAQERCSGVQASAPGGAWRLPTIRELESLIVRERNGPAAEKSAFALLLDGSTVVTTLWSATPRLGGIVYVLDINDGAIGDQYLRCPEASQMGCVYHKRVLCVR